MGDGKKGGSGERKMGGGGKGEEGEEALGSTSTANGVRSQLLASLTLLDPQTMRLDQVVSNPSSSRPQFHWPVNVLGSD